MGYNPKNEGFGGPNWALEDGSTFQSWAAFLATASEHESGKLSRAPL